MTEFEEKLLGGLNAISVALYIIAIFIFIGVTL